MSKEKVVLNTNQIKNMSATSLMGYFEHVTDYYSIDPSPENIGLYFMVRDEITLRMES